MPRAIPDPNPEAGRRLPVGAEPAPGGGFRFRVWAPDRARVEVIWCSPGSGGEAARAPVELERETAGGYFAGVAADAAVGDLYRLRLDGGGDVPDPASRFQPEGPRGPSELVDAAAFRWRDGDWRGVRREGQVIYELHIGTCTAAGTWEAAAGLLPELAELGVTVLEVMPVAEFPGRFGWGYDGVALFAPTRLYGDPDDFRRFVDRAHGLGLGVILDVVYNHFGPDGNHLAELARGYFTDEHANEWGTAIWFDGPPEVRELFLANVEHWIAEYHLDGLRLDATQDIHDSSPEHIVAAMARTARRAAAALPPGRSVLLVGENEPQDSRLVRPPAAGGYGLDAIWVDDFHHAARVALTGHAEAYYSDFQGSPRELVACARFGPLFQGQRFAWQHNRRGVPAAGVPLSAFVAYLENHDQVANSARGARLHTLSSPGCHRALTALLLLGPATPMLFQGQESGAAMPWVYFADHRPELAEQVLAGRRKFLCQFPSIAGEPPSRMPAPEALETFLMCKLEPFSASAAASASSSSSLATPLAVREHRRRAAVLALHRDLLRLRREDPTFRLQGEAGIDGAVLGESAFVLRFFAPPPSLSGAAEGAPAAAASPARGASPAPPSVRAAAASRTAPAAGEMADDRLLLINLGRDLALDGPAEPLLAPPLDGRWEVLWSSEEPRYEGSGAPPAEDAMGRWRIRGQAAVVMRPVRREADAE